MRDGKDMRSFLWRLLKQETPKSTRTRRQDARAAINAEIDRLMACKIARIGERAPR